MKQLFKNICLFIGITIPFLSYSQSGSQGVFTFLNIPNSARVAGLGGNTFAINDGDVNLTLINPSLLNHKTHNKIGMSYVNYFAGTNFGYTTYSRHFKKIGTFGMGIQFLNYGTFDRADITGQVTGQFKAADYCYTIGYARPISKDSVFSFGANLKSIYSTLDIYSSFAMAVDMAITASLPEKNFTATIILKNAGYQFKPFVEGNRENLPAQIDIGISKKPKHMPVRFCLTYQHLQKWDLTFVDPSKPTKDALTGDSIEVKKFRVFNDKLGRHLTFATEIVIKKNYFIRLGYNYLRRKELQIESKRGMGGMSIGFGFNVSKFSLSYSRASYSLAGGTNTLTISTNLSSFSGSKKG